MRRRLDPVGAIAFDTWGGNGRRRRRRRRVGGDHPKDLERVLESVDRSPIRPLVQKTNGPIVGADEVVVSGAHRGSTKVNKGEKSPQTEGL